VRGTGRTRDPLWGGPAIEKEMAEKSQALEEPRKEGRCSRGGGSGELVAEIVAKWTGTR